MQKRVKVFGNVRYAIALVLLNIALRGFVFTRSLVLQPIAMKVFNGAVHVTQSPPLASATGYLFYYAAIHPIAVAQSDVLTTLLESSGDAQLPSTVSLPDFELWQQAVVNRAYGGDTNHRVVLDMQTICAILKVWHYICCLKS